jgi:hypothetical protein
MNLFVFVVVRPLRFGISLKEARIEVEKIIGRGSGFVAGEIPFTPRAKRVLELALQAGLHKLESS